LPVVSRSGNEIDFTIGDLWRRAGRAPSGAAEIITGCFRKRPILSEAGQRLGQLARQQIETKAADWSKSRSASRGPTRGAAQTIGCSVWMTRKQACCVA